MMAPLQHPMPEGGATPFGDATPVPLQPRFAPVELMQKGFVQHPMPEVATPMADGTPIPAGAGDFAGGGAGIGEATPMLSDNFERVAALREGQDEEDGGMNDGLDEVS